MPSHKEEEPVEFKVVDRRKFTADGAPREDVPVDDEPEQAPPPARTAASAPAPTPTPMPEKMPPQPAQQASPATAPQSASTAAPPQAPEPPQPSAEQMPPNLAGGVQFEHLIMSLVTQAMLQLGLATRPGELAPHPDLPAAHETIDILGILQQKTKGNLTMHEDQLLSGSVTELRMAYVELNRRAAGRIN